MRNIIFMLSVLFLIGCSSVKVYKLESYTKLSSPNISLQTPNSVPSVPWKTFDLPTDIGVRDWLSIWRHLPNMMSEDMRITVRIIPQDEIASDYLLYKNKSNQMEERIKNFKMSDWEKKNNAERGVNYVKQYVDFIGGLKCGTRVESSNIALGVGTKSYQTNCTYFDNQGGAKNIHLAYSYTYTHSGTKNDRDTKSSSITPQAMQTQFKQDMKAIFDSLVIHDMDREKMNKEELLYDKKYDLEGEFR
ncbi:MAG: hypothetical protein PHX44_02475 [Sulfurimonas sp.]|uniref:hypothetical protein n=1 Tax=Sulfurimonas sp. TaxID=2022749 RepID=UPI00260D8ED4|nr:hypothetical protein [Sulfurimonas sp.]MDD2651901.1 hypothetical protein [Sulfurimonas sp.]MDD3451782.1 hypothetical protein [Sulfurimonas sp.]